MPERPIVRLPDPRDASRKKPRPPRFPQPRGPGRRDQGARLNADFTRLAAAVELGVDPTGVSPERALVFETAGKIQDFARAARDAGLELIAEIELEDLEEYPPGFEPPKGSETLPHALYATMPSAEAVARILRYWNSHQRGENAPNGATPWWRLFDLLLALRPWGPDDRFPTGARAALEARLPADDAQEIFIEFEIWPSSSAQDRAVWRRETLLKLRAIGARIADTSSIDEVGFVYEAILAGVTAGTVRELLEDPYAPEGLAWVKGIQFILPHTEGQSHPSGNSDCGVDVPEPESFDETAPFRAALFDGTPAAAHRYLEGGVEIEDVHDLVQETVVINRLHATAMASLILRGDLGADGEPLLSARIVSVPIAIEDHSGRGVTAPGKLFVNLVHDGLSALLLGEDAVAPEVFVVNLSMNATDRRFAGQISSIARLIDWWAFQHGVLFVVSSGNVPDGLFIDGTGPAEFLALSPEARRKAVQQALIAHGYGRCLMAPAEALNCLSVGAISEDLSEPEDGEGAGVIQIDSDDDRFPAISCALGLGPFRSIKPDFVETGGKHGVRAVPNEGGSVLTIAPATHSGLVVASPRLGPRYSGLRRSNGTSCAAALTTRAILECAEALEAEDGPFQDEALSAYDLALLTRGLAVHSATWIDEADYLFELERERFRHATPAKAEVCKHFGHGALTPLRMQESPGTGITLVGIATIKKDQAKIFDLPLPQSLSGDNVPRSMRVTLSWFSPTSVTRARYRLASLQAIASDSHEGEDEEKDPGWGLLLKGKGPDENMVGRGTVWSRRLVHDRQAAPAYPQGRTIPVRVQCKDASGGGLSADTDIRFAISVTLEVEAEVQYDVYDEVKAEVDRIKKRVRPRV